MLRIVFSMLLITVFAITARAAPDAGIEALREALRHYQSIERAGGWAQVGDGAAIQPGGADQRLEALAHRLTVSRDIPDEASLDVTTYGGAIQEGVVRFQRRHGLEPDGIVGPRTLAALNVPVERRVEQIRVNLARARSQADVDAVAFVLVNVPAFRADLIRSGQVEWTTRVIVGEDCSQTPVFESILRSVVINPTWTVPHRIATQETLPRIKADPGYLERGGYQLRDPQGSLVDAAGVDWEQITADHFPFTLVQRPGPVNQLGRIKFMIPNEYDVFMHDTPAKHLFEKTDRAHSHGCIRVDKPLELAHRVLAGADWTKAHIATAIQSEKTRTVALRTPIPVIVVYRTVEVDDAGTVYFYNDIYERDAAVPGAIDTTRDPVASGNPVVAGSRGPVPRPLRDASRDTASRLPAGSSRQPRQQQH